MIALYSPWASSNNMVLIAPQAVDCWAVHEDTNLTQGDKTYFTKEYPQYLFSKNLINAASNKITDDFNYRQANYDYPAYDQSLFAYPDYDVECKEFINQSCELAGDCFITIRELDTTFSGTGFTEATPEQCPETYNDPMYLERQKLIQSLETY